MMKRLLLSSSFINIFIMSLNFIFKIFLSHKIDKESLGLFYTFMDLIALGMIFFSGFKDSLIKAYDEEQFEEVLYWYLITFWSMFIVIFGLELIYYSNLVESKKIYPLLYLFLMLFANSLTLFVSFMNASFKIYKIMLFENLVFTISLVLSYFFLSKFFIMDDIQTLFFTFFISYFIKTFFIAIFSPMKFSFKRSPAKSVKLFFKNSALSSMIYFFSLLSITSSSLIILNLFGDKNFLAEFQVVIRSIFFSLVAIFIFPLNSFTFPEISRLIAQNDIVELNRIERSLIKYLVIFFIIIVISLFFTKWGISLIFPKNYWNSYKMLNLILPMLPFIAYTTFAINIIKGFNRFDLALYVRIFGSLIFFVSVIMFYIFNFSAETIIFSLDLSFLGMFLISHYFRTYKLNKD